MNIHPRTRLYASLAAVSLTSVLLLLASCTKETLNELPATNPGSQTFSLTYTLPRTESGTLPSMRSTTPLRTKGIAADAAENQLNTLDLLFFAADAHRNGVYITTLNVSNLPSTSLSTGTMEITLPTGSGVNNETDYDVLAVANLGSYTTNVAALTGKTLGRASAELRATLTPAGMPDALLMTGIAAKQAGKDLNIDLLRAAVRIELKKDGTNLTLHEARLWNVPTALPFYYSEGGQTPERINIAQSKTPDANGIIRFYTTEVYQDISDARVRLNRATCLLINVTGAAANKGWFRVNLVTGSDLIQYLQRNNAYTVNIIGVTTPGGTTPEEAYYSEATLLGTVTLTGWIDSGVTPPEVDIN